MCFGITDVFICRPADLNMAVSSVLSGPVRNQFSYKKELYTFQELKICRLYIFYKYIYS